VFEPFVQLALVASVATGVSLGLLGVYLVIRRVVFFGLVLANAVTLGAAVAEVVGWPPEALSLVAGVLAAAALGDVDTSRRVANESLMGWAYTAASASAVLILSQAAGGSADTLQLLFGNVLAVGRQSRLAARHRRCGHGRPAGALLAAIPAGHVRCGGGQGCGCQNQMVVARDQSLDRRRGGVRGARDRRATDVCPALPAGHDSAPGCLEHSGDLHRGCGARRRGAVYGARGLVRL
jgi:hypothetical protein